MSTIIYTQGGIHIEDIEFVIDFFKNYEDLGTLLDVEYHDHEYTVRYMPKTKHISPKEVVIKISSIYDLRTLVDSNYTLLNRISQKLKEFTGKEFRYLCVSSVSLYLNCIELYINHHIYDINIEDNKLIFKGYEFISTIELSNPSFSINSIRDIVIEIRKKQMSDEITALENQIEDTKCRIKEMK